MSTEKEVQESSLATQCYLSFIESLDALPKSERINAIDDLIHRLQFEKRWQLLDENQVRHMCDESLSDTEAAAIANCVTVQERDERIDMYARARYFRRCAWITYLNGEGDQPPVLSKDIEVETCT